MRAQEHTTGEAMLAEHGQNEKGCGKADGSARQAVVDWREVKSSQMELQTTRGLEPPRFCATN